MEHETRRTTAMKYKRIILTLTLALTACAPAIWDRPGTTGEQFAMDRARCELTATAVTTPINTTSPFYTFSQNVGASIADGIVEGIQQGQNFNLCMAANGYQRRPQ